MEPCTSIYTTDIDVAVAILARRMLEVAKRNMVHAVRRIIFLLGICRCRLGMEKRKRTA